MRPLRSINISRVQNTICLEFGAYLFAVIGEVFLILTFIVRDCFRFKQVIFVILTSLTYKSKVGIAVASVRAFVRASTRVEDLVAAAGWLVLPQ